MTRKTTWRPVLPQRQGSDVPAYPLPGRRHRRPDLDDEPSTLDGLKVTLSAKRLLIEVAAGDQDALKGDEVLEIHLTSDLSDLDEVKQTLENILTGTGTFVCEL